MDQHVTPTWDLVRGCFRHAARDWTRLVGEVSDAWDEPGLGEWSVRSLVGHTSRALLTVEQSLAQRAEVVEVLSPGDYYRTARPLASGAEVTVRGVAAGDALGSDPAAFVAEVAARVLAQVDGRTGDQVVPTVVGAMRLADYLPTRTFELTVHALDLARAADVEFEPAPAVSTSCLALTTELAVADRSAGTLLRAATGRGAPHGFSVL